MEVVIDNKIKSKKKILVFVIIVLLIFNWIIFYKINILNIKNKNIGFINDFEFKIKKDLSELSELSNQIVNKKIIKNYNFKIINEKSILAFLNDAKYLSKTSIIYLMNSLGTTVVCTPYGSNNKTLINKNYSFRPYFKNAIKGNPFIYFALGVTTNKRGVYFSNPIKLNGKIKGVLVIKQNLVNVINLIKNQKNIVGLLSPDNIIFLSNDESLEYCSFSKIDKIKLQKIYKSKQFGKKLIKTSYIKSDGEYKFFKNKKYNYTERDLNLNGWKIFSLMQTTQTFPYIYYLIISGIIIIIGLLLYLYINLTNSNTINKHYRRLENEKNKILSLGIKHSKVGIVITDINGNIIFSNKAFENISGYSEKELKGKKTSIFKSDLYNEDYYKKLWDTILSGEIWEGIFKNIRKDGSIYWDKSQIIPMLDTHGKINRFVAVKIDITEIIGIQNELKKTNDFMNLVFDTIPAAIFTVDKNKKIQLWNNNAAKITGYSKEEIKDQYCNLFTDEPCFEHCGLLDEKTEKPLYDIKCTIKNKAGEIKTILKNVDVIQDTDNNIIGGIESFYDITEKEQLEQQLIRSEKLAAVGELANGIGHEFNNLLTIIKMNNEILNLNIKKNNPEIYEKYKPKFNDINLTCKKAADIINEIKEFSKPTSIKKELADISLILDSVLKLLEHKIKKSNIAIEKKYQTNIRLKVDKGKLGQVFMNLIINAIHAILLSENEKGQIVVELKQNETNIEINFKDNGIGIDEENINKIFTPFFTTKYNETSDVLGVKGTGLGLSISYKIIKQHNGKIIIDSVKNQGSTFKIILPINNN